MPISRGKVAVRLFSCPGIVDQSFSDFRAALEQGRWVLPPQTEWEEVAGWTTWSPLLHTDFAKTEEWVFEPYYGFQLRVDKKRVNSRQLKLVVERAAAAWKEERGAKRCPKEVVTQYREDAKRDLLRTAPAVPSSFEILCNARAGNVYLASQSDTVARCFLRLWRSSFPTAEITAESLLNLDDGAQPHDFLLWLLWRALVVEAPITRKGGGDFDLHAADRVQFCKDTNRALVVDDLATEPPETRAALSGGKDVIEVRVMVVYEEREYTFTIRGLDLSLVGVKLPATVGGVAGNSGPGSFYDRVYLLDELHGLLGDLGQAFAKAHENWSETRNLIQDWIDGS